MVHGRMGYFASIVQFLMPRLGSVYWLGDSIPDDLRVVL